MAISRISSSVFAISALVCSLVVGQTEDGKSLTNEVGRPRTEAEFISRQLRGDSSSLNEALARVHLLADAGVMVHPKWVSHLFDKGKFQDVADIAAKGVLNAPENTKDIQHFQKFRARALLRLGKIDEAVVAAKANYNLSALKDTQAAVTLLSECLAARKTDEPNLARRFVDQQVTWASVESGPPETTNLGENVLKSIQLPSEPYLSAAMAIDKQDYFAFTAKGNLLLLADHAAEAKKAFEAAEHAADRPDRAIAAVEGIARAIRAESGALGPANAFVVSRQNAE